MTEHRLTGCRRAHGRNGIRNHVLIIQVDDFSNAFAGAVAEMIPGTILLPRPYPNA